MIAICWSLVGAMVCQLGIVSQRRAMGPRCMVISLHQRVDMCLMGFTCIPFLFHPRDLGLR